MGIAQGVAAVICAEKRDLRHRIAQHAGSDRVPAGYLSGWPARSSADKPLLAASRSRPNF